MFCKLHSGIWKPVIIQSFYCSKIYDRNPWVSLRETVSFHRKLVGPRRKTVSLYLKTHGNPQTKPTGKLTKFFEIFFFKTRGSKPTRTHGDPQDPWVFNSWGPVSSRGFWPAGSRCVGDLEPKNPLPLFCYKTCMRTIFQACYFLFSF